MKKNVIKQFNVGTSRHDFTAKPYGFCCDIKDHDPRLTIENRSVGPLFCPYNITGGGPDIRFRIQDADSVSPSSQRSVQRSTQRIGQRGRRRSGYQSRQRGGYDRQRGGDDRQRDKNRRANDSRVGWDDEPRDGQRDRRSTYRRGTSRTDNNKTDESLPEPMICKRCRGPLKWYLEDEIAVARDRIMTTRQETYNAEMEENVRIAKKKEKMKRRKRKGKSITPVSQDEEKS
ncbi:uncharacterized protein LOC128891156 [Hylaeus anthracinus]|uniref:uncharacterized protein LOC128891156 n=1 Tax=Hylaeus anthracinus TaxID=313031 RepID=UPI0023B94CF7|nr:uncharacterized protein LOC128891156 [Hylaeus anthracinus]